MSERLFDPAFGGDDQWSAAVVGELTAEQQATLRGRLMAMRSGTPAQREARERLQAYGLKAIVEGDRPSARAYALLLRAGCTVGFDAFEGVA